MIGYVCVGTNDLDKSSAFYAELLSIYGATVLSKFPKGFLYGVSMNEPMVFLTKPNDDKPATVGNGMMVALKANSKEQVEQIYNKALELGGTCEGKPGYRAGVFYCGYFRDLDGNKLNCYWVDEEKMAQASSSS